MAVKDVVEYIRDAVAITYEENSIPVFTQKSITDMCSDRLIHHGSRYDDAVSFVRNTHVTRVWEKILEKSRVFVLQRKVEK